jgi:hypothetical protein
MGRLHFLCNRKELKPKKIDKIMKNQFLFLALIVLSGLTSCSSFKSSTTKSMGIYGAGIIQKPVLVDLDVKGTRVTGMANGLTNKNLEMVKQDAVADALKKADADILVEPKFETAIRNGHISVTVTGFPATYKNFRSITAEDVELLAVGHTQKADVYEPVVTQKKGSGALVLGLLAAITSVILIIPLL